VSLHQQLIEALDDYVGSWTPPAPVAALRAVVELHAPRPCAGFPVDACFHLDTHNVCGICGPSEPYVIGDPDSTARCSTVQAIARELGVQDGDCAR
jgi:hypothetical protein